MKQARGNGTRSLSLVAALLASLAFLCAGASSASALTFGLQFTGDYGQLNTEMPEVGKSGANVYRIPLVPANATETSPGKYDWTNYNNWFTSAAENGFTLLPIAAGRMNGESGALPTAGEQEKWSNWIAAAVRRYGYKGEFWSEHSKLTARPVTTWEITNEPDLYWSAAEYGQFLAWAGPAIQNTSKSYSGTETEVLFGGILSEGVFGAFGTSYGAAKEYLKAAYKVSGVSSAITGVAIHPYEVNPEFYSCCYSSKQAFEVVVSGFRKALNELSGGTGKALWITEEGWPTVGSPKYGVSESEQATLLRQTFDYAKANATSLNLRGIVWYNYRNSPDTNWAGFCGLRDSAGGYRPSWFAFQEETGVARWPGPSATTTDATGIRETQATLNGQINPQGLATSYHFEYGTSTTYSTSIPVPDGSAGAGSTAVAESATVTGLQPRTHYHYRIVGTSAAGTVYGDDHSFTTGVKWMIRNANSGGAPDSTFWYGLPGEVRFTGDWDGNGTETPGSYDPQTGTWKLRNSNSTGGADITPFSYGGSQYVPVVGDWNGDGKTTIGLYEPTEGRWLLRNSNSGGSPDVDFPFGGSQYTPVVGDWDGNGTTTVGLFEKNGGNWVLRNVNAANGTNISFQFGGSQYKPVAGDWDHNGTTTVGLYESNGGNWVLKNTNEAGGTNINVQFGGSQFEPVVADWDGNGETTIGLMDSNASVERNWLLRNVNEKGSADLNFSYGMPGQVAVVGDWDGNGTETPGTFEPSTGKWRLRNTNSSGERDIEFQFGGSQYTPVVGDWDGNGTTTVGLFEPSTGNWVLKNANEAAGTNINFQFGGSQYTPIVGDWDGNGTTTVGLFEKNGGNWVLRNVNAANGTNINFQFGGSQYTPIVGDWDGNGTTTVGLYEPSTGNWVLKNANEAAGTNINVQFGGTQFDPVAGDWDGNKTVTVGLVSK